MHTVKSTCCYCGTGCGVEIDAEGDAVLAIRGDSQLGTEAPEPAPAAVVEDREALLKRIEQLENELAAARAALAKLEP